jgi:sacsin
MVMVDPQGDFFDEGGAKLTSEEIPTELRESLNLVWFQNIQDKDSFPGTIIRLPLRTEHHRSKVSTKTISCQEIEGHFQTFVQMEMDICLLFLSSLRSVEFWVIREGEATPVRIALSSIMPFVNASPDNIALSRRVETTLHSNPSYGKDWLIRWHSVPNSESQDQLSTRISCDVRSTMETEKLAATVALAIPISVSPDGYRAPGRLFTYLPLPSDTSYPCNIHAPFALTIDRQTLRNEKEEGLHKGSDDQYVFSTRTSTHVDCIIASASSGIGTCSIL